MTPIRFPEANAHFGPPDNLEESQCHTIAVHKTTIAQGSCEGLPLLVTAWKPDARELAALNAGGGVFLSFVSSGLPPHFVTTNFAEATNPA